MKMSRFPRQKDYGRMKAKPPVPTPKDLHLPTISAVLRAWNREMEDVPIRRSLPEILNFRRALQNLHIAAMEQAEVERPLVEGEE